LYPFVVQAFEHLRTKRADASLIPHRTAILSALECEEIPEIAGVQDFGSARTALIEAVASFLQQVVDVRGTYSGFVIHCRLQDRVLEQCFTSLLHAGKERALIPRIKAADCVPMWGAFSGTELSYVRVDGVDQISLMRRSARHHFASGQFDPEKLRGVTFKGLLDQPLGWKLHACNCSFPGAVACIEEVSAVVEGLMGIDLSLDLSPERLHP
jgi:hypothetical protein